MLSLGCALIDPIDAVPVVRGTGSFASGGASAASGGASAGSDAAGGACASCDNGGAMPNSGGFAGDTMGVCETNADCDQNSRCLPTPARACVPLITDVTGPCPILLGSTKAADPNALFIGAFAPLDETSIEAQTIPAVYKLAVDEFNNLGLPDISGGPASPLVVIVCNNSLASVPDALRHLIRDVQVPAVLAAMDPKQLLDGFNEYKNTFFVSAFETSSELAKVSAGRAWTMAGPPADYADIYHAIMPYAEAWARADLPPAKKDRPLRVAAVREKDNSFEAELADAVLHDLTFNGGQTTRDQPTNYLEIEVSDSNVEAVAEEVYGLQPDIIFSFARGVFVRSLGVMVQLDRKTWADHRPLYILSPENAEAGANDVTAELTYLVGAVDTTDYGRHVLGISRAGLPVGGANANSAFVRNLQGVLTGASPDFGNYYDAFYFLAYAMYASPRLALHAGRSMSGDLGLGMYRLTNLDGTKFNIGSDGIPKVFEALDEPNNEIQLWGTLGRPEFDRKTGMRREPGSVYCFDSTMLRIQKDAISYDRETKQLTQALPALCLWNFLSHL